MMFKIIGVVACLAVARAGVINTSHSPASVSSVYSSANEAAKPPAPIYETQHEDKENTIDGFHKATYYKSVATPYASIQKFDAAITNNGALLHSYPTIYSPQIHSPVYYNPTYSVSTPLVAKTTHYTSPIYAHSGTVPVLTKTYTTPILTKTSSAGISALHAPIVQDQHLKTTITYSEAPLVSHMTFSGLGANYAW